MTEFKAVMENPQNVGKDGCIGVVVVEAPGCFSAGDTKEEAKATAWPKKHWTFILDIGTNDMGTSLSQTKKHLGMIMLERSGRYSLWLLT